VILENNGQEQLVYKHAIASIAPTSALGSDDESRG
jgi:sRNA-binding regulator protein Hfq